MRPIPAAFRTASKLRGARAFHPRGVVWEARWTPGDTSVLPGSPLPSGAHATIVATASAGETITFAAVVGGGVRLPPFAVHLGGPDVPVVGTVEVGDRVDQALGEALRFDPWNTGPELEPVGSPNRVRRPTYAASQDGRGAPDDVLRRPPP